MIRLATGSFPEFAPKAFENLEIRTTIEGEVYVFSLWDTAAQEEYDKLRPISYPYTDIFLLCFSMDRPQSFHNIATKWNEEIQRYWPESMDCHTLLVQTKIDLQTDPTFFDNFPDCQRISYEEGCKMARNIGAMGYVELSALSGEGIHQIVDCTYAWKLEQIRRLAEPTTPLKQDFCLPSLVTRNTKSARNDKDIEDNS
jgi:small GTP-binding protein